jgi:hypothetical protein
MVMDQRIYIPDDPGVRTITLRKPRERVVAEITLAHLSQFAEQMGRSLSSEEALAFLNQIGRAYEMWKRMMHAGEDYLKTALQTRTPVQIARPGANRGVIAV